MAGPEPNFDVVAGIRERAAALAARLTEFLEASAADLERASETMLASLARGGTIFTCGNGGSAAHAMHLEAELVGRYRADRRPLPCVYLGMSASSSTAMVNDYGAEVALARPLQALGAAGDVLIAFSTSGTSPNVVRALDAAREQGIASILVTGPNAPDPADIVLRFPGPSADAIQDGHDLILHALMDAVDAAFVPTPASAG
jgi:D-sedoheptulose 7-phosphate isomerase